MPLWLGSPQRWYENNRFVRKNILAHEWKRARGTTYQLVFCLPSGFSRKMDVELPNADLKALNLLKPLVFEKNFNNKHFQALRTKSRYRTTVGDVRGNKTLK